MCRFKLKIKPDLFIDHAYKLTMILVVCYPGWSLSCDDSDINTDDIDDDDVKDADDLMGIKTRNRPRNHFWDFVGPHSWSAMFV